MPTDAYVMFPKKVDWTHTIDYGCIMVIYNMIVYTAQQLQWKNQGRFAN